MAKRKTSDLSRNHKARLKMRDGQSWTVKGQGAPGAPPIMAMGSPLLAGPDNADATPEEQLHVFGRYPRTLLSKAARVLGVDRGQILHVCSGSLPRGEGMRVDIRAEVHPDVVADGRKLPFGDSQFAAVLIDPPYTRHYAEELYQVDYPRPKHLLREAVRVALPGRRVGIVHYFTPACPVGASYVQSYPFSTGFGFPWRALSIYEKHSQGELF
jgi:hypothetical protein